MQTGFERIGYAYIENIVSKLKREKDASKFDNGRCLIAAGSFGMAGAAVMSGSAAVRTGAGLVTYYAKREIIPVLQISVPEAMAKPIDENIDYGKYDAIAMGPGLLCDEGAYRVEEAIATYNGPLVLDAEALNTVRRRNLFGALKERRSRGGATVITPHEGEAAGMLGTDRKNVGKGARGSAARALREKTGATVVMKGSGTLVAYSDTDRIMVNTTGGPGLATGGSGDVLTGIIAALLAQGIEPDEAAAAGVYIHGLAGDLASYENGEISVRAMDIVGKLPGVISGIAG